jgi:hypothetical protein
MNPLKIKKNPLILQSWQNNTFVIDSHFLYLCFSTLFLSTIIVLVNKKYFLFLGYPYAELSYILDIGLLFFMVYIVKNVLEKPKWVPKITDICLCFSSMFLIAFLTYAVQLSPFSSIDWLLGQSEWLPLENTVNWTNHHELIRSSLKIVYNMLTYALIYCPIINILFGNRLATHQFCRFMLLSSLIGFTIYYFFPSSGPASYFGSEVFSKEQHANHVKFWIIHHGVQPINADGGLIAFPSFHVIYAWACCRVLRCMPKIIYYGFFSYFFLTCMSCFLLGWHYSTDFLGSFLVIYITEKLIKA